MTTITIPVTYPGLDPYALEFQTVEGVVSVCRSWVASSWIEVHDMKATPLEDERVLVEINGDLSHGAPVYAIVTRSDWEGKLRGIRG